MSANDITESIPGAIDTVALSFEIAHTGLGPGDGRLQVHVVFRGRSRAGQAPAP